MLDAQNREPVSNYGQAVSWLFTHSDVAEWAFDPEAHFPKEARLVCDIFWVSESQLLKDVRKIWNGAAGPAPATPAFRRSNRSGWR